MSIILAQRHNDEILLLGDTKISSTAARRPDELPGNLKVITFAKRMTAAFAGNVGAANVAIKRARLAFYAAGPNAAIEVLRTSSRNTDVDYIVASHHSETKLMVIRNGGLVQIDNDVCSIGQSGPFSTLIKTAQEVVASSNLNRGALLSGFIDVIMTGKHEEVTVGGFPIAVIATAENHRYLGGRLWLHL